MPSLRDAKNQLSSDIQFPAIQSKVILLTEQASLGLESCEKYPEVYDALKVMARHQLALEDICKKYKMVAYKVVEFHRLWSFGVHLCSSYGKLNTKMMDIFEDIEHQFEETCSKMDNFSGKVTAVQEVVKGLCSVLESYVILLTTCVEVGMKARCLEDLPKLPNLNLKRILKDVDSKLKKLTQDWKEMQLDSRMKYLIAQLETLTNCEPELFEISTTFDSSLNDEDSYLFHKSLSLDAADFEVLI